jgi:integrase
MTFAACSVCKFRGDKFFISVRKDGKAYRFYNGEQIGEPDKPNLLPLKQRYKGFQELLIKYQIALRSGWNPVLAKKDNLATPKILGPEYLYKVYEDKLKENLSHHVYKDMKSYITRMVPLVQKEITEETFQLMPDTHPHWNNTTFNNYIRYASLIEKGLTKYGYTGTWSKKVKRRRKEEKLHKKFSHVQTVLSVLFSFNRDLHLCALLTYGCLLRPHREIRELKWGDFNQDLSQISLAGNRNKSKRNRIIPVPDYIREHLSGGYPNHNIFSGTDKAYNPYYFSLLWSRLKKQHPDLIAPGQTLYSFRHTGAIAVYEKTKNIKILQTVMGHSDMAVSLTYLRGLEVNELDVDMLPGLVVVNKSQKLIQYAIFEQH